MDWRGMWPAIPHPPLTIAGLPDREDDLIARREVSHVSETPEASGDFMDIDFTPPTAGVSKRKTPPASPPPRMPPRIRPSLIATRPEVVGSHCLFHARVSFLNR